MKTKKIVSVVALALTFATSISWAMDAERNHILDSRSPKILNETKLASSFLAKNSFEIPITIAYDYFFVVEATVNGAKMNFLFEESSLHTIISKEKADLLSVNESTQVFIGNQSFGANLKASDFTKLKAAGLNVDGIIGSSIVDYYDIHFDLDHGRIICIPY